LLLVSFFLSLPALRIEAASSRPFGRYSGKPDPRQPNAYYAVFFIGGNAIKKVVSMKKRLFGYFEFYILNFKC
jgi:hypothetical protein